MRKTQKRKPRIGKRMRIQENDRILDQVADDPRIPVNFKPRRK